MPYLNFSNEISGISLLKNRSEGNDLIAFLDYVVQILHRRYRTHLQSASLAELEACASAKYPASIINKRPHLLGNFEVFCVDRFGLYSLCH